MCMRMCMRPMHPCMMHEARGDLAGNWRAPPLQESERERGEREGGGKGRRERERGRERERKEGGEEGEGVEKGRRENRTGLGTRSRLCCAAGRGTFQGCGSRGGTGRRGKERKEEMGSERRNACESESSSC